MANKPDGSSSNPLLANGWLWAAGYLLMLVGIVIGMREAQQWSVDTYDNEQAVKGWQEFRTDVINQPHDAPVSRRTPKSETPPAKVLLNDYFGVCLTLSVVLCSALYLTFMVMIRGAMTSPGSIQPEQ